MNAHASRTTFGLAVLALLASLSVPASADYNAQDDAATAAMQSQYYPGPNGLWNATPWWNQAEIMESFENTMVRTNGQSYVGLLAPAYAGHNVGPTPFINGANDDNLWWGLMWLRAYDLTGDMQYYNVAVSIFQYSTTQWNTSEGCHGGILWSATGTYINAVTNELFLVLAIRLHERTPGDTASNPNSFLSWALAEWDWFAASGMINGQNLINDGLAGGCVNNNGTTWTYNQGVVLAGLTDLYKVTGNMAYLSKAETIANAVLADMTSNGILIEPCEPGGSCNGDQDQFKGIFMRYLFYLYDTDHDPAYYNFLAANARSIWGNDRGSSTLFGLNWAGPYSTAVQVTNADSSGMCPEALIADPWTQSMAFCRGSADPEFNHTLGQAAGTLAWSCDPVDQPTAGYMQWGPYASYLPNGAHTAHFRLAVSTLALHCGALVHLDIRENNGGTSLGQLDVPWNAFVEAGKAQDFDLPFTQSTSNDPLEFRVYWNAMPGSPTLTVSDVSVDGGFNWTAANLGHAIGRLDGNDNWEADPVRDPASGFLMEGPATSELGASNCVATFEVKVDNFNLDSAPLATLAVVDADTGTTLTARTITRDQFPNILFQEFPLSFTSQGGHHYDYRVWWNAFPGAPRLTARGVYVSVLSSGPPSTPTPVACGYPATFGDTAAGTGGPNVGGQLDCSAYALSQPLTVNTLSIYMGAGTSGSGVLGIYADNAGSPGTLLAQSMAQPLAPGWNVFAIAPTPLLPGTYWLSGSFTGAAYAEYSSASGGTLEFEAYPYTGALPCSMGTATRYGWLMSIDAQGCVPPTPTPTFTPTTTPPACAAWSTAGSAFIAGQGVTLTTALNSQAGAAWSSTCISLAQDFNMTFKAYLGVTGGADGIDFVLQDDARGTGAVGYPGGDKGYAGAPGISPSVAFDLETYGSNGTLLMLENGSPANTCAYAAAACPFVFPAPVANGLEHSYQVVWNAGAKTLTLIFDGMVAMVYDRDLVNAVFRGNTCVYYGFTAATGGSNNLQYVYEVGCQIPSPTPTSSPSATLTPSPTATPSPSPSVTPSPSPSSSPTATASQTPSPTGTPTVPPSVTPSLSPTASAPPSPTPSASPTATATATLSLSVTPTISASPSFSPATTASPSRTSSPTASPRPSPLETTSATPSPSATHAPSPGISETLSATAYPSPSSSPTTTSQPAPTVSPTPSPLAFTTGPLAVLRLQPFPDPQSGPYLRFAVDLLGNASSLSISLYDRAWVKVGAWRMEGSFTAGWNQATVFAGDLPSGVYFVIGQAGSGAIQSRICRTKILVLR